MKTFKIRPFLFLLVFLSCLAKNGISQIQKPNILLINIDDLGWCDLGWSHETEIIAR